MEEDRLMRITISANQMAAFTREVRSVIDARMTNALLSRDMHNVYFRESERITQLLVKDPRWQDLTGRLRGEYGFTEEEVSAIKALEPIIAKDPEFTTIDKKGGIGGTKEIILNWLDYQALFNRGAHPLTRLRDNTWELLYEVNWVDWLENGATIHENIFNPKKGTENSRSGEGYMENKDGGLWILPPSKLFANFGFVYQIDPFRDNIAMILRKQLRTVNK